MKFRNIVLCSMVLFISACASTNTSNSKNNIAQQSVKEIQQDITSKHPSSYIILAAKLLKEGKPDEAAKWYYVGQMRFRAYLMANPNIDPSGDPALYSSLKYVVGTPINEYAGQNPDHWVDLIEESIKWNSENPNGFTPKLSNKEIYAEVEASFIEFRDYVLNNKEKIRKQRAENGLKNS
ncbi:hypothetical protein [Shewanella sp. UCD-KL21]|uniref:hypothetical protein n=1 Tax=Shewanella sp. UCD-KL21 TaxID=1917164 RepID=UPI0011154A16|nr:hypothetical protein [Shewanella sp. UCD-KL21]